MSSPFHRFGAFRTRSAQDCRVEIGGKGRKNILAVTGSYLPAASANSDQIAALAIPATFQGRLVIIEGSLGSPPSFGPPDPEFTVNSTFDHQKVLFDVLLNGPGPHPFFYPIAQQEGSPQSDEDSTINIILCVGRDGAGGFYIPALTVSGQTVFGNTGVSFAGGSFA